MQGKENLYNDPYVECGFFRLDRKDSENPASDWYLDHFHIFLQECSNLLLDNIGRENIRAIILGGSFALGEGTISFESGSPIFLSDIDLLVVMDSVVPLLEVLAIRDELGRACEGFIPEARFIGRVDVGAVLTDELKSFARSPGNFVMRKHGKLLYGDESVLERLPSFGSEDITRAEALTLLENRMACFLGDWPCPEPETEDEIYAFLYEICRSYTDLLTAVSVITGNFVPGYHDRWKVVREGYDEDSVRAFVDESLLLKTRKWTIFKMYPSIDILEVIKLPFPSLWLETAADLLVIWEKCMVAVYGKEVAADRSSSIRKIAAMRSSRTGIMSNIRSWKELMKTMSIAEAIRTVLFARSAIFRTTPSGILRSAAVHLVSTAAGRNPETAVEEDAGGFPFGGTDWMDAAKSCNHWWNRLVFGRDRS